MNSYRRRVLSAQVPNQYIVDMLNTYRIACKEHPEQTEFLTTAVARKIKNL